jgi:O-acetyl-ADP-ribose deacetylase
MDNEDQRLFKTYMNVLEYAQRHGLSSIAFPVISSGRFRFPREWALSIALSAIRAFLETHEMMVFLVIYHEPSHALSRERFDAIRDALSAFGLVRPRKSRKKHTPSSYMIDDDPEPLITPMEPGYDRLSVLPFERGDFRLGKTFVQHLFDLIDQRDLDDVYVYKKANVDRKLFSKIRSDDNYKPSKRTALAFAFALELGIEETDTLIMKAGYALSDADTFDMIVRYMISSETWDLYEVNKTLFAFGQKTIGCD